MLISSFKLKNGTMITALLKFILILDFTGQTFISLLSKGLGSALRASFSLLLTLGEKKTRIHSLELLLSR